ncbi:NUDIX hydrolase [Campylobacter sp. MIT 99-7217]|uniref:NUDIX domain-containing protein n=1 Tax=Campylobacter sp. MIT 99-7217 TaxID=535091 RepID=UPI0011590D9B|nr:NUDIX domain-containing protein [Campylobacter sp. MIT 99-7217]TQR29566.1 NUDIX hydrolase [Campylobacter sp. MIT 99-7217]
MDLKTLREEKFTSSKFIKLKHYKYEKNGKEYTWDFIESMDSVAILLYHKTKQSFVFVRQFRIPLYDYQKRNNIKLDKNELGYSIELCSGLVDKNLSLEDIAKEECVEELGYMPKSIEKISDFYSGFGSGTSKQSLYFAEIDEDDKISKGGGIDDEEIESVFVKVHEFENFKEKIIRSTTLDFSYLWFMKFKAQKYGL